jgi:hypothetical protein
MLRRRRLNLILSRSDKGWRALTTGSANGLSAAKNGWERRLMPAGNSAFAADVAVCAADKKCVTLPQFECS